MNDILELCRQINEQGKYFAFFRFSGHVNAVSVSLDTTDTVYSKGSEPNTIFSEHFAVTDAELIELRNNLKEFLK